MTVSVASLATLADMMRVAGCTYSSTPPSLPDCIASSGGACPDGSSAGLSFQKISETQVLGYYEITRADGLVCAYDLVGIRVSS